MDFMLYIYVDISKDCDIGYGWVDSRHRLVYIENAWLEKKPGSSAWWK